MAWEWTVYSVVGVWRCLSNNKLNIVPRFFIIKTQHGDEIIFIANLMLHIGKKIKEIFDGQPKSHTINWFASQLNCDRRNIYHIFNRPNIDIELLKRISIILGYDFFRDISQEMTMKEKHDDV